ncbi:MAG: hypothetical protein ACOYN2_00420 [Patescibacteria group bacterium]
MIYLEDEAVDTEDNAEKSMKIIQEITPQWQHNTVNIAPLSSDFHTKRIGQAFERNKPENSWMSISPVSAEKTLKKL